LHYCKGILMIHIQKFVFYLFQENSYLVWDDSLECVIVDPGCERAQEREDLFSFISTKGLKPKMILLTHAHLDHIYGVKECSERYGIPVMMDPKECESIEKFNPILTDMGMHTPQSFDYTSVEDGQELHFGATAVRALSTPGHSMGGMCWWFEKEGVIFSGDTLFKGSIGRTDNNYASLDALMHSLRSTLMQLDGDIQVFPGHGPSTTIGEERRTNPFIYENNNCGDE